MSILLVAFSLALQGGAAPAPTTPSPPPLRQDGIVPAGLSPAHDLFFEDAERLSPFALSALRRFAGCVAAQSPARAGETLVSDFTSARYRSAIRILSRNNEGCFSRRSGRALYATGLPFAGALAEHLMARDPVPINVRLARAAAAPAPRPYAAEDRVSLCVVRSVPDEIGRLMATEMGSAEEAAAVRALEVPVRVCSQGGPRIEAPPVAMRAMLATAAYRTLAVAGTQATQ